jgi:hypothetical protein
VRVRRLSVKEFANCHDERNGHAAQQCSVGSSQNRNLFV